MLGCSCILILIRMLMPILMLILILLYVHACRQTYMHTYMHAYIRASKKTTELAHFIPQIMLYFNPEPQNDRALNLLT